MRKKWWLFLLAPPAILLFGWLFGEMIMHLWNWLLPGLFGWKTITFWQGLGLLVLCRTLFGGWGGGNNRGGKKWKKNRCGPVDGMTPEEREHFRQRMRDRAGFNEPGSEARA